MSLGGWWGRVIGFHVWQELVFQDFAGTLKTPPREILSKRGGLMLKKGAKAPLLGLPPKV